MRLYLESLASQLRNFSSSLDKTSILIDKPWALIDEGFEMQKLIFKKNKQLILSRNGQVQIGKWDYFPEAKSLLIDRNQDIILCNEAFIDKGVMILRVDGTENHYFVLANENVIPDLNAARYLQELRKQKLKIFETRLASGKILEVKLKNEFQPPQIGCEVGFNAEAVPNGIYHLESSDEIYEINSGKISKILTQNVYKSPTGEDILIQQQFSWTISKGDYIFLNGERVYDGEINFSKTRNIIVKNGIIVKLQSKNLLKVVWGKILPL